MGRDLQRIRIHRKKLATPLSHLTTGLLPHSSFPPLSTPTRGLGAVLQLLQNINHVVTRYIQYSLRFAPSTDFLNNIVRVGSADNGDLRCEPLLEWFCNEVAIRSEPPCERSFDLDGLGRVGFIRSGLEGDGAFVNGRVLWSRCGDTELWSFRR